MENKEIEIYSPLIKEGTSTSDDINIKEVTARNKQSTLRQNEVDKHRSINMSVATSQK